MTVARIGAWVGVAVVAACVVQEPPADPALDRRIQAFPVHRTDHFAIHYDTALDLARATGERMEATYRTVTRFCERCRIDFRQPAAPMKVVLFDRLEEYERFRRQAGPAFENAVGFYSPDAGTSTFYNLLDHPDVRRVTAAIRPLEAKLQDEVSSTDSTDREALKERVDRLNAARNALVEALHHLVIQHETVHQTLQGIGVCGRRGCCPDWLAEGLACLFEVEQPEPAEGVLRPNRYRLGDVREALSAATGARPATPHSSTTTRRSRMPIPLTELLHEFGAARHDKADLYAESWALVYYLVHAKPDSFAEFLRVMAQCSASASAGHPAEPPSFEAAFGRPTAEWEEDWTAFVSQLPLDDADRSERSLLARPTNPR